MSNPKSTPALSARRNTKNLKPVEPRKKRLELSIMDKEITTPKPKPNLRLVTIASNDNPMLLVSSATYPPAAGSQVTFDQARTDTNIQPYSWWVLHPVTKDRQVFQILFHSADGNLCLTASAATANASLTLSLIDPSNPLQLWHLISNHGQTNMQIGFLNDIPLKNMALQLIPQPDTHETGDAFIISDVMLDL
jgi:hypothetical protein